MLVKADEEIPRQVVYYMKEILKIAVGIDLKVTYNTTLYWDYKDWYLTGYGPI